MNFEYKAFYYLKLSGRAPLEEYFGHFDRKGFPIAEITTCIDELIKSEGYLPAPYTKHVWGKLYELRFKALNGQQRIFYFIHTQRKIILLDGYTKKTAKIPKRILDRVKNYYFDYLKNGYEKEYE